MPNHYIVDEKDYCILREAVLFLRGYLSVGEQSKTSRIKVEEAIEALDRLKRL